MPFCIRQILTSTQIYMMLQIIIFSFNRALQLDTLIRSLKAKWNNPTYRIDVIYNTTDSNFEKGYDLLKRTLSSDTTLSIRFHKENSCADKLSFAEMRRWRNLSFYYRHKMRYKSNFRSLCNSLLQASDIKYVMFLTDDTMFINPVDLTQEAFDWIDEKPYGRQISLRAGIGMNGQNKTVKQINNNIFWNFYENEGNSNWGYPFSVDAHIYAKEPIVKLFTRYIYCNPNTLEGNICTLVRDKKWFGEGMGNNATSILSYPINMVQNVVNNESLGVDCELLNQWFLDGYTMSYPVPEHINVFQQYPELLYLYKENQLIKKPLISKE